MTNAIDYREATASAARAYALSIIPQGSEVKEEDLRGMIPMFQSLPGYDSAYLFESISKQYNVKPAFKSPYLID